jgi:hypothetical protein
VAFLNLSLLFGLAAVAVPIALHLFGRKPPKRIPFPALRFLRQQHESTRRRMEFRQWVLLALRMGLVAALALALAQPWIATGAIGQWLACGAAVLLALLAGALSVVVWSERRSVQWTAALLLVGLLAIGCAVWLGRRAMQPDLANRLLDHPPAAVALLIDNSPRMDYRDAAGPRLEQARGWAEWLLDQYPAESRFAVLDASARPVVLASDVTAARRLVESAVILDSTRSLDDRIEAAARVLRTSQLPQRVIYVLTDLSSASWDQQRAARLSNLLSGDKPVAVQVIDLGNPDRENLRLNELRLSSEYASLGSYLELSGEILSEEAARSRTATIELGLYRPDRQLPAIRDGKLALPGSTIVDRIVVTLDSQQTAWRFALPPLAAGIHHGWIAVSEPDPLAIDNRRYFTIAIESPPRIAVLGSDATDRQVIGQALASDEERRAGRAAFDVIADDWNAYRESQAAEQSAAALVVLDPPVGRDEDWRWLAQRVQAGAGAVIVLGPRLGPDSPALPPSAIELLGGRAIRSWREPLPGSFLQIAEFDHPALQLFQSPGVSAPWSAFPVSRYWELEPSDSSRTLAYVASSRQPLLFEHPVGRGRVLVITTPLPALGGEAASWNGLMSGADAWPMWLLLRESVRYAASGARSPLNFRVGQSIALSSGDNVPKTGFQMFGPDANPLAVQPVDGMLSLGLATRAGNYWLRSADQNYPDLGVSANIAADATDLARLSDEQLLDWLGATQARVVRRRDQVDLGLGSAVGARPYYSQLMLLAAGLWLLEWLVGTFFYQPLWRRSTAQPEPLADKPRPTRGVS